MSKSNGNTEDPNPIPNPLTTLSVGGFKSILDEQTMEVRPLTLLAGANSSGKSSMLQPLLLLKQTLEAQYDPGPLLLNGPNAKFTSVSQFWPLHSSAGKPGQFVVTIGASGNTRIGLAFRWDKKQKRLEIEYTHYCFGDSGFKLSEGTPISEVTEFLGSRRGIQAEHTGPLDKQLLKGQNSKSEGRGHSSKWFFI